MTAITILLGLGVCVFLLWFFDSIVRDVMTEDDYDSGSSGWCPEISGDDVCDM